MAEKPKKKKIKPRWLDTLPGGGAVRILDVTTELEKVTKKKKKKK